MLATGWPLPCHHKFDGCSLSGSRLAPSWPLSATVPLPQPCATLTPMLDGPANHNTGRPCEPPTSSLRRYQCNAVQGN
eukprot:4728336-Karenia_brevis.AAC.1